MSTLHIWFKCYTRSIYKARENTETETLNLA